MAVEAITVLALLSTVQTVAQVTSAPAATNGGFDWVVLILGVANLLVVAIAAGLLWKEIHSNHEWNRRRAAHDLIFESTVGKFRTNLDRLSAKIGENVYDPKSTSATIDPGLTPEEYRCLDATLNYLENMCLAVKNNVVDEDIAFGCLGSILVSYWRWADPYVTECRKTDSLFWIEIDPYAKTWGLRAQAMRNPVVEEGKDKL